MQNNSTNILLIQNNSIDFGTFGKHAHFYCFPRDNLSIIIYMIISLSKFIQCSMLK